MNKTKIYLLLVLTTLLWSSAFVAGKFGIKQFPSFSITFFRFFFAVPLIFAILYYYQPKDWRPKKGEWYPFIWLGIVGTFGYHIMFFMALKHTGAINASLIGSMTPLATAVLASAIQKEQLGAVRTVGFSLSLLGVGLITTGGDWRVIAGMAFNRGDVFMSIGVCCWAVYSLFSSRAMQKVGMSPLKLTAYNFLGGAVVALPFALMEQDLSYLLEVNAAGWLSVFYMAAFPSVLGYLFFMMAIKELGSSRAAAFINLTPVFTIFQAWYFLDEPVTILKITCAALIIAGVMLAIKKKRG